MHENGLINEIINCWWLLVERVGAFFAFTWPLFAGYAVLYAITAALFLLTLKVKSEDGSLVVGRDSLPWKLAHPYLYGQIRRYPHRYETKILADGSEYTDYPLPKTGNICAFYARLFNMVLFVWPVLLLYFAVGTVVASLIGLLIHGGIYLPDLSCDAFFRRVPVAPVPLIGPAAGLALLVLAIFNTGVLWSLTKFIAWGIVCGLPLIALIVLGVFGTVRFATAKPGDSVSVFKEAVSAKKERFCKMIQYR